MLIDFSFFLLGGIFGFALCAFFILHADNEGK